MNNVKVIERLEKRKKFYLSFQCKCNDEDFRKDGPYCSHCNKMIGKPDVGDIDQAIQWGEALQSAEGELPEEKKQLTKPILSRGEFADQLIHKGFNQARDIIRPRWAKNELRIKELENTLKGYIAEEEGYLPEHNLQQELATLKNSNEQLKSWVNDHPEIKKLEQENAELKAELKRKWNAFVGVRQYDSKEYGDNLARYRRGIIKLQSQLSASNKELDEYKETLNILEKEDTKTQIIGSLKEENAKLIKEKEEWLKLINLDNAKN